ncbi:MAG: hypothetical protein SPF89_04945 [Sphaerochaetaceae bacterium]|nr:hypothetical protein [Spirochaetales bacterium]MDY5499432.1 hypothetical protein [Sphaerochaetaceae bacterium]
MRKQTVMGLMLACQSLFAHGITATAGISWSEKRYQPVCITALSLQGEAGHLVGRFSIPARWALAGNVDHLRSLREHHGLGVAFAVGWQDERWSLLVEGSSMRLWSRGDGVSLLYAATLIPGIKGIPLCSFILPLAVEWQSGVTTFSISIGLHMELP